MQQSEYVSAPHRVPHLALPARTPTRLIVSDDGTCLGRALIARIRTLWLIYYAHVLFELQLHGLESHLKKVIRLLTLALLGGAALTLLFGSCFLVSLCELRLPALLALLLVLDALLL